MKKWLSLIVILFGGLFSTATAQDNADLVALAQYFPADTPFFMTVRTDDDFIATLDAIWMRILPELSPGDVPPGTSVESLLDLFALASVHQDFASGIRPWIGDSIAVAFFNEVWFTDTGVMDPGMLVAVSITNRSQAETFLMTILEDDPLFKSARQITVGDYTVSTLSTKSGITVALSDEVLLIADSDLDLPLLGLENPLVDDAEFNNLLTKVPESLYDLIVFIPTSENLAGTMSGLEEYFSGYDPSVATLIGMAIRDEQAIILDTVSEMGDYYFRTRSADIDFLAHIPADASIISHTTDPKGRWETEIIPSARENFSASYGSDAEEFDENMKLIETYLQFMTGLDPEKDILDWMTGELVVFGTMDPNTILSLIDTDFLILPVLGDWPFGFGVVVEVTDPDQAAKVVKGFYRGLIFLAKQDPRMTASRPKIDGAETGMLEIEIPLSDTKSLPFNLLIGSNDEVFVVGTFEETQAILKGEGGFNTNSLFNAARQYMLDDPAEIIYVDSETIALAMVVIGQYIEWDDIKAMIENSDFGYSGDSLDSPSESSDSITLYHQLNNLLGPASATTYYYEDGNTLVRMVIMLDEAE